VDVGDFFRGLFVGAAIAVPVGPVNLLTVRRTLTYGRTSGVATGLGAALADAAFAAIAAFGLTFLSEFLISQQVWLRLAGGVFLIVMGLRALRLHVSLELAATARPSLFQAALSSFLLTLSNPITLIGFGAVFAAVGVVEKALDTMAATLLTAGAFCGSMAWWCVITTGVGTVRARTSVELIDKLSQLSGALIALFGLGVLATLLPRLWS